MPFEPDLPALARWADFLVLSCRADPPRAIWCRQRCWTRWDPTDS